MLNTRRIAVLYALAVNKTDLSAWVRDARAHAGLTLQALADKLFLTKGNIWHWEKGNHQPSYDQLVRIAEITGFSMPATPTEAPDNSSGLFQSETISAYNFPPLVEWEELMSSNKLPQHFRLQMPDDSLAGRIPRGAVLIFDTAAPPKPGVGVLIEDASGRRHVRRFDQAPNGGWLGTATNESYVTFSSDRDNVQIVATMVGRLTGDV